MVSDCLRRECRYQWEYGYRTQYALPTFLLIPGSRDADHGWRAGPSPCRHRKRQCPVWPPGGSWGLPYLRGMPPYRQQRRESLANVFSSLTQLNRGTLTIIGDGFGSYVANQAAQLTSGLGNIVALNPPSLFASCRCPPNLNKTENSRRMATTSLYDAQASIAALIQTVDTGNINNPLLQHESGLAGLFATGCRRATHTKSYFCCRAVRSARRQ